MNDDYLKQKIKFIDDCHWKLNFYPFSHITQIGELCEIYQCNVKLLNLKPQSWKPYHYGWTKPILLIINDYFSHFANAFIEFQLNKITIKIFGASKYEAFA